MDRRDDERAAAEQSIERREQELLGGGLIHELLQVVDQEQIAALMAVAEVGDGIGLDGMR